MIPIYTPETMSNVKAFFQDSAQHITDTQKNKQTVNKQWHVTAFTRRSIIARNQYLKVPRISCFIFCLFVKQFQIVQHLSWLPDEKQRPQEYFIYIWKYFITKVTNKSKISLARLCSRILTYNLLNKSYTVLTMSCKLIYIKTGLTCFFKLSFNSFNASKEDLSLLLSLFLSLRTSVKCSTSASCC